MCDDANGDRCHNDEDDARTTHSLLTTLRLFLITFNFTPLILTVTSLIDGDLERFHRLSRSRSLSLSR